jgi:Domain of unknown function (DUF4157)
VRRVAVATPLSPSRGAPAPPSLFAPARPREAFSPALADRAWLNSSRAQDSPPADPRAGLGRAAPLPRPVRALMESTLGWRFERVRIHADDHAARAAQARDAAVYTIGEDIVFSRTAYAPTRGEGLSLLAHELVHVAQWYNGGRPAVPRSIPIAERLDAGSVRAGLGAATLEAEASDTVMRLGPQRPPRVSGALRAARLLSHPVYVSKHGTPDYLEAWFFERWGYSPVMTGVDSIEEIVADLARMPQIGRVTIVTHSSPLEMQIALINGGYPAVFKWMWRIDTPGELPALEHHSPEEIAHQGDLAGLLEADAQAGPIFRRLGGTANPLLRAWVRSATERAFAEGAVAPAPGTMPEEAERALESDRQWLALRSGA